jgi:hypothetical protein
MRFSRKIIIQFFLGIFFLKCSELASNSISVDSLSLFKKYLEEGTYQGAEIGYLQSVPKSRYDTLRAAFEHFENTNGKIVVELGTTRSFVHGGLAGCNLDDPMWWTPNQPENWDWGAGFFTLMAAISLSPLTNEFELHTVDLSKAHINRCKIITEQYKTCISYHVNSSENFLMQFPESKKIDLLYMDTGDMTPIEPTAQLHMREAKIIIERDLMAKNGLILIDDVRSGTPKKFGELSEYGKAKYSLPYLLENGFEILMDEYQVLLRKTN